MMNARASPGNTGCINCKPPKRHPGCHSNCEEYLRGLEDFRAKKNFINEDKILQDFHAETHDRLYPKEKKYR